MNTTRRARLTSQNWMQHFDRYLSEDVPVAEYCLREDLNQITFYCAAQRLGVIVTKDLGYIPNQVIVQEQTALLDGHLLGDGCLMYTNPGKNHYPVFTLTTKHQEYANWIVSTLEVVRDRSVWERNPLDKRTGKRYLGYWIRSLSSDTLKQEHARWYKPEGKRVPRDLVLTPELLLRWFLDDGGKTSGGLNLATDGFPLEDVLWLCEELKRCGFNARPHKNDSHYRIYIPTRDRNAFLDTIGSCPVRCFDYKWL